MPQPPTPGAEGSTESALASSSKPFVSSTSADLFGHALRTSLASELEALTGFALRWKASAMPSGRSWWALGTPGHRTGETESGSSLPTCRATDGDRGGSGDLIQAIRGNSNKHFKAPMLPTPTLGENMLSPSMQKWAGHRNLADMLATPTARDWRSGKASPETHARNSRPLSEQLGQRGLHGTAVLLPVVAWMMGYPPDWHANGLPPTATPSCPKLPKRSGAR
jgi:hypothetical protein